ncbi:Transketolase, partial [Dimargaris xerosporica]
NLPNLEGSSVEKSLHGGYVLQDVTNPQLVLVATGSEVAIAVDTAKLLEQQHQVSVRVVSMPCLDLFDEQSHAYKESVFPRGVPVISIEVLSTVGWGKLAHASIGLDDFGKSGPYQEVYHAFGFYPEAIAKKAQQVLQYYKSREVPYLMDRPFE